MYVTRIFKSCVLSSKIRRYAVGRKLLEVPVISQKLTHMADLQCLYCCKQCPKGGSVTCTECGTTGCEPCSDLKCVACCRGVHHANLLLYVTCGASMEVCFQCEHNFCRDCTKFCGQCGMPCCDETRELPGGGQVEACLQVCPYCNKKYCDYCFSKCTECDSICCEPCAVLEGTNWKFSSVSFGVYCRECAQKRACVADSSAKRQKY